MMNEIKMELNTLLKNGETVRILTEKMAEAKKAYEAAEKAAHDAWEEIDPHTAPTDFICLANSIEEEAQRCWDIYEMVQAACDSLKDVEILMKNYEYLFDNN